MPSQPPILLAFSGGLDTSYCIPWLIQNYDRPVVTATVNTGGDMDASALERLSKQLGASNHFTIPAEDIFFDEVIKFLIMGNVTRGHLYPICVGAERNLQARECGKLAQKIGATAIAHGCTAAGNDQFRFEITLRTLFPELEIIAPVRDFPVSRSAQVEFLRDSDLPVPAHGAAYSVNQGLWGVTVGGVETLTSKESIPESAWPLSAGAFDNNLPATEHVLSFSAGIPIALDGVASSPVDLIALLTQLGASYGIGRGIHVGDTMLGIKGRVGFEAPAATLLLQTHRELEKITLSEQQQLAKDSLATTYGNLVHKGRHLDPACRDMEAYFLSSQQRVTGDVFFTLQPGNAFVTGVQSPHSLMDASRSNYGESATEWTGRDAAGVAKIFAVPTSLHHRAAKTEAEAL